MQLPSTAARKARGPSALEIAHLGSCHIGKYLFEISALENALGEVSKMYKLNIIIFYNAN